MSVLDEEARPIVRRYLEAGGAFVDTPAFSTAGETGATCTVLPVERAPARHASTHCFRPASRTEAPENHYGTWRYPDYSSGIRDRLTGADFGSANCAIKDSAVTGNLAKTTPSGIPFDPDA